MASKNGLDRATRTSGEIDNVRSDLATGARRYRQRTTQPSWPEPLYCRIPEAQKFEGNTDANRVEHGRHRSRTGAAAADRACGGDRDRSERPQASLRGHGERSSVAGRGARHERA